MPTYMPYGRESKLLSFDIFERLLFHAFNGRIHGNWKYINETGFEPDNLSLLLCWPIFLQFEMITLSGNVEAKRKIERLKSSLNKALTASEAKDIIDDFLTETVNPDFFGALNLFYHPKSIVENFDLNFIQINHSIANYVLFCFLIVESYEKQPEILLMEYKTIRNVLSRKRFVQNDTVRDMSLHWVELFLGLIDEKVKLYDKLKREELIKPVSLGNTPYPSLNLLFEEYYIRNLNHFAEIQSNFNHDSEQIASTVTGMNISLDFNLNYYMWYIPQLNDGGFHRKMGPSFLYEAKTYWKSLRVGLIFWLREIAKYNISAMYSFMSSWERFFYDPKKDILSNINGFKTLLESILENQEIKNQFFETRIYSRIFGDLETEIHGSGIQQIREIYTAAKIEYIPYEIELKMVQADNQLRSLVNDVAKFLDKKRESERTNKVILNYFKQNKNNYEYLNLLEPDDIKMIYFDKNRMNKTRDNRRNILPIIYRKLSGKKIGMDKIEKSVISWRRSKNTSKG